MINIEKGKKSFDTVKKDGVYLQSLYDPRLEAKKFIENIFKINNITFDYNKNKINDYFFIIFGSALGYIVEELISLGVKEEGIFVFEPDEILLNYLKSKVSSNHYNILIINEAYDLSTKIEEFLINKKKPLIIAYDSYKNSFKDEYEKFIGNIINLINKVKENIKVTAYFSKIWYINYLRNLILSINNNNCFYIKFDDKYDINYPILIVASSPGLIDFIDEIKKFKDYFIIVSVLSAARTLIINNIKPDYIIISDAGVANKLHFYQIYNDIPIFANVYANSAALSTLKNKIIFYNLIEEIDSPLFNLKYPSVTIEAGLIFSKFFNNICFAGFDLSYDIKLGTHSIGNAISQFKEKKINRLNNKLSEITSFLFRNDLIYVNGNIFTNKQFVMIKEYVDLMFKDFVYLSSYNIFNLKKLNSLCEFKFLKNKEEIKSRFENNFRNINELRNRIINKISNIENYLIYYSKLYYKEILTEQDKEAVKIYYKHKINIMKNRINIID